VCATYISDTFRVHSCGRVRRLRGGTEALTRYRRATAETIGAVPRVPEVGALAPNRRRRRRCRSASRRGMMAQPLFPRMVILTTGVQLTPSDQAQSKRASFDLPATLIVTVSADGPVTVFSDGVNVFEWAFSASVTAEAYRRASPSRRDGIWPDRDMAQCPKCGKHSRIEKLTIAGYRDDETADCPVCKTEVATGRCTYLHANIVKVL